MTGSWVEGNTVHLPDVNGFHASIPARVVHLLRETAKAADDARAKFGLRWFDRDVLIGAAELLDERERCTEGNAHYECDRAAVFDLRNRLPKCADHKEP